MKRILKSKRYLIITAIAVVAIVAFVNPEYAENVARAFALLIGVM